MMMALGSSMPLLGTLSVSLQSLLGTVATLALTSIPSAQRRATKKNFSVGFVVWLAEVLQNARGKAGDVLKRARTDLQVPNFLRRDTVGAAESYDENFFSVVFRCPDGIATRKVQNSVPKYSTLYCRRM